MKKLDWYILKSFLIPFFATFLIILFVLVMQALWLVFDDIAGKNIGLIFIFKFLWYTTLIVSPQALPIGILLSSIMTLGSLSENYEFAAAKSAGVSLPRLVRSLAFFAILMSGVNFLFLNNVYPYAIMKQLNLKVNIKKKQPAMALVPGSFNSEMPNFQIKFDEKYGEENNLLKNVLIYDLSERRGNKKIIRANTGKMISEEGSRYMTLILNDGYYFENHLKNNSSYKKRNRIPASYANFDQYTINIDISSLLEDNLDDVKYTKSFNMLNVKQLKDTLPSLKSNYDQYVKNRAKSLAVQTNISELKKQADSIKTNHVNPIILENFSIKQQASILNSAVSKIDRMIKNMTTNKNSFKTKRKILNLYDIEFYNRVAFSLSCLLLFFIGAPLGSIIRKGGMGLPMILAIAIYVTYFFSNTFGRNLAEESSITAIFGSWLAVLIMTPLAIILTVRAAKDKGLFDVNSFFISIINMIKKLFPKKKTLKP